MRDQSSMIDKRVDMEYKMMVELILEKRDNNNG